MFEFDKQRAGKQVNKLINKDGVYRTADINGIEKILKKAGVKFPSYRNIQHTLEKLEQFGILKRRYVENKNADFYWILNPKFSLLLQDQFKEIEKL